MAESTVGPSVTYLLLEDTPMLLIFGRRTHSISLPPLATSLAERAKAYMLLTLDEASQIQSSRSFANSS